MRLTSNEATQDAQAGREQALREFEAWNHFAEGTVKPEIQALRESVTSFEDFARMTDAELLRAARQIEDAAWLAIHQAEAVRRKGARQDK